MDGTIDVKSMAMAANIMPSKNESMGMSSAQGEGTSWKAAATAKMIVPVINERFAPQKISPAVICQALRVVERMTSKVF